MLTPLLTHANYCSLRISTICSGALLLLFFAHPYSMRMLTPLLAHACYCSRLMLILYHPSSLSMCPLFYLRACSAVLIEILTSLLLLLVFGRKVASSSSSSSSSSPPRSIAM